MKKKRKKRSSKTRGTLIEVLNHKLVPKMRILSEKEKENLLKKWEIDEIQLPKIHCSDPAAQALNAQVGNVLEIERVDMTGKYRFYRLVIE